MISAETTGLLSASRRNAKDYYASLARILYCRFRRDYGAAELFGAHLIRRSVTTRIQSSRRKVSGALQSHRDVV